MSRTYPIRAAPEIEERSCGRLWLEAPPQLPVSWRVTLSSSTGGARVGDADTLARLASASVPGDTVLIRVIRGDAGRTLEIVVGERPGKASVLIYYRTDADQETAEGLVTELRKSINDPR